MNTHIGFSRRAALIAFLALLAFGAALVTDSNSSHAQQDSQSNPLSGLRWRNIGPFRGGRSVAVAGVASQPTVYYFGGTGGGVFKTTHGDGVYKSTDAGKTWRRVGLEDSRVIGRIRIHPKNPDLVYVAALGHAAGPNDQRGVFRSKDGGKNWERVLFKSNKAGAVDLSMDPSNPNVLYASIWEAKRTPYSLESGGPDSGLYKT